MTQFVGTDPEVIPDLTDLPRPRPARRTSSRKAARAEAALVRAEAAARTSTRRNGPPLAVVRVDDRPHVRLGIAWAGVTTGAALLGPAWLAVWLAAAAAVAAGQLCVALRAKRWRPAKPVAMATAAGLPLAALAGPDAMTAVVAGGVLLTLVAGLPRAAGGQSRATADAAFTLLAAVPAGLAAASPVLVRTLGLTELLVLLALVWVYDAGAFLVGTGAASAWEGPAAGVVCTIPVVLVVAAVLVNPFDGASPWLLGLTVMVLAPLGQAVVAMILHDTDITAPALCRLDSLLAAGPVWAWAAVSLLR